LIIIITQGGLTGCRFTHPPSKEGRSLYNVRKNETVQAQNQWVYLIKQILPSKKDEWIASPIQENFWETLQKDFHLHHHTNRAVVQAQIEWFTASPHHLSSTIKRSAPYIHYIYEQVKKRHLPAELVLLPLVESTYNPLATNSTSGASGLWQLTSGTARGFGIRQDLYFDGRHDIYASTHAALDYLTYLNQFFSGNWLLTLAAYDTGEGNVQRAIRYNARRNLSTSFWNLPLALETRSYVPRLLALSAIIKNPEKYGLQLPFIGNQPYLAQVDVKPGISIVHAAELANISIKELKRFNPGFKQLIFVPNKPYRLLLPTRCAAEFKKRLAKLPPEAFYLKLFHYKTQPKDTLITIARKHQVSLENLCLWNGLEPKDILPINKNLIIKASPSSTIQSGKITYISQKQNEQEQYYTVRKGDNLYTISKLLGIKYSDLHAWNQLKTTTLKPGQRLKIKPVNDLSSLKKPLPKKKAKAQ
jgi:membrane-bound lytic murein transglycosylase D